MCYGDDGELISAPRCPVTLFLCLRYIPQASEEPCSQFREPQCGNYETKDGAKSVALELPIFTSTVHYLNRAEKILGGF